MTAASQPPAGLASRLLSEAPAFGRRELLETLTYRMALFWDIVGLAFQALTFFYISKLVNPTSLPTYGDSQVTYIEFVAVGIPVSMFVSSRAHPRGDGIPGGAVGRDASRCFS